MTSPKPTPETGDIVVTVPKGYFRDEGRYEKAFFTLGGRRPKRLKWNDRIYIAYEGFIEEFYEFWGYNPGPDVEFEFGNQRELSRPFPCKGFQGFRYADRMGLTRQRGRSKRRAQ